MADRILHQPATVYILSQAEANDVTISVWNPMGALVESGSPVEEYSNGLSFTLLNVDIPGLWQVQWNFPDRQVRETFSVDSEKNADMTVWELRAAACRRVVDETHIGYITEANGEILVDETVIGGQGSYKAWWITIDEPGRAVPHRVVAFTGSGFTVRPRLQRIPRGTRYLLTSVSPHEFDLALSTTMTELSPFARIPVRVSDLSVVPGEESGTSEVVVPRGINKIHEVTVDGAAMPVSAWRMLPGRRVLISTEAEEVSIEGTRAGTVPKWEDSYSDFDSGAVLARVATLLHASRAAGQTMDEDDNLRRQMAAMDEYMELRRRSTGRPHSGQRDVID